MNHLRLMLVVLALVVTTACDGEPEPDIDLSPTPPPPTVAEEAPASPTAEAPTAPAEEATATVPVEETPAATPTEPEVEATATEEEVAPQGTLPQEFIFIQEPGDGSRVTSPIRVRGESNSTFEQNIVVRLVGEDGTELALQPTTLQANLGQRGPFEVEIPIPVQQEQNAFIQVFADSPRDGALIHLSSVGITLAEDGEENIVTETAQAEKIVITEPAVGGTISGGTVRVAGTAVASFEQSLVVDILDATGNTLAREPITVDAAEQGQRGSFSAEINYTATESGPGRIVVREVSPAFGGTAHLNSVEVRIEP